MTPRTRMVLVVAVAAAAAAALAVGVTLATRQSPHVPALHPRPGAPPLALDLGLRADPEARALARAAALYGTDRSAAGRIFRRYASLQAQLGAAFAAWPDDSLAEVATLAGEHPGSSLAQLQLGLAQLWAGRNADAVAAFRAAKRLQPDTASAVVADGLLHPGFVPGIPIFVPSFPVPPVLSEAALERQRRAAASGSVRAKLAYGVTLQRLRHQVSAERAYAAAAREAPNDPEAQVAAAVARFDKSHPERAFSRLGPLAERFPRAPTVRFHLGLLLFWIGQARQGRKELVKARAEGPSTPLGREANRYLTRLEAIRTR